MVWVDKSRGLRQGDRVIVSLSVSPHAEHCSFMHHNFFIQSGFLLPRQRIKANSPKKVQTINAEGC